MAFDLFFALSKELISKAEGAKAIALLDIKIDGNKIAKRNLKKRIDGIIKGEKYDTLCRYEKHCKGLVAIFDKTLKNIKKLNKMLDELKELANSL